VKHGVATCKEEVLGVLRRIAASEAPKDLRSSIAEAEASDLWKSSECLAHWFNRKWQPHCEVRTGKHKLYVRKQY
jgi:hypothetical protein